MLSTKIRKHIFNIYGFVRFADEIVDSFHEFNKEELLNDFENEYYKGITKGISLNPILNSFQLTVNEFNIPDHLIQSFLKSMKADLKVNEYQSKEEINEYIYGSADVVGLMCLKVFVNGNEQIYNELKESAMSLGSAFQKVNFLRDLKDDIQVLNRSYFPEVNLMELNDTSKNKIILDIENDFKEALKGIKALPKEAKFGVYTAYRYYRRLLNKLKKTPSKDIMNTRIRISNSLKAYLLITSYIKYKLKFV